MMIWKVVHWLDVEISSLRAPRIGYESQIETSHHRVEMASATTVYFGLERREDLIADGVAAVK